MINHFTDRAPLGTDTDADARFIGKKISTNIFAAGHIRIMQNTHLFAKTYKSGAAKSYIPILGIRSSCESVS